MHLSKRLSPDAQLLKNANIVISSYLGESVSAKVKHARFEQHRSQRKALKELFPDLRIVTIASQWPQTFRMAFEKDGWDTVHRSHRMLKAEIHNMAFKYFYSKDEEPRSLLLLDDDVLPIDIPDLPVQSKDKIHEWLTHPSRMPAECVYFSCKGLLRDAYYNARKDKEYAHTHAVSGFATLIHGSLKVRYKPEDIRCGDKLLCEDIMFRFRIASEKKEALKANNLFFELMKKSAKDSDSVWHTDRDARKETIRLTHETALKIHPRLFLPSSTQKRLKPVWSVRGRKLQIQLAVGNLIPGSVPGSYLPTRKLFTETKPERMTLIEALKKGNT